MHKYLKVFRLRIDIFLWKLILEKKCWWKMCKIDSTHISPVSTNIYHLFDLHIYSTTVTMFILCF